MEAADKREKEKNGQPMKEKIQKRDIIILTILWLSYLAFNGILLAGHELWRDEANVWLIARELSVPELFAQDGLVNHVISAIGLPTVDWFQNAWAARFVIIIALVWRWTGYNMVFYLAGLQNIDYSVYEASRIDGASPFQQFTKITIPLLKPTILLTAIMSTSGTLQLFDESVNLTAGGPGKSTMTLTHYIYNISFVETPKFNYAAALSVFILIIVAILSAIQMKVGDKRE